MTILEEEAAWRQTPFCKHWKPHRCRRNRAAGLNFADAIRAVAQEKTATVADQLSLVLDATGYRQMLRDSRAETIEGRLDNIQELIQLAGSFNSARELLDHAALATGAPDEDATGAVRLLTLHRAKGLEFPEIFLPAWEDGVFPTPYGDHSEERRLAYVAITRGVRRVTILHCEYRRGHAARPEFIQDIPEENRVFGWHRPCADTARQPGSWKQSPAAQAAQP